MHHRYKERLSRDRCRNNVNRKTKDLTRWTEKAGESKNDLPVILRLRKAAHVNDTTIETPVGPAYQQMSLCCAAWCGSGDGNILPQLDQRQ